MRKFRSMAEFEAYRARVRELGRSRGMSGLHGTHPSAGPAQLSQNVDEPCDPSLMDCDGKKLQEVVTTGSRARSQQSITNNQESGVDEGDIVKLYGRFLVVLQDGRLFTIDTGSQSGELRLVDRVNLYASSDDDTWYDELLIHDDTLVVTGYSYDEEASVINILSIDED